MKMNGNQARIIQTTLAALETVVNCVASDSDHESRQRMYETEWPSLDGSRFPDFECARSALAEHLEKALAILRERMNEPTEKQIEEAFNAAFAETALQEAHQRIAELEAEVGRLENKIDRALAKVDGVDYTTEHYRANLTPDEQRDVILGLASRVTELEAKNERLRAGPLIVELEQVISNWRYTSEDDSDKTAKMLRLCASNVEQLLAKHKGRCDVSDELKAAAIETVDDTEVLDCGCTVMRGWRCPFHGQP